MADRNTAEAILPAPTQALEDGPIYGILVHMAIAIRRRWVNISRPVRLILVNPMRG